MESCIFNAMGTTISLQIQHDQAQNLLIEAKNRLLNYEKRFSANNLDSQLMLVNQAAGKKAVKVDSDLFELIEFGKLFSLSPTNALNITIGPLVKLWKIGFSDARVPSKKEIEACRALINPEDILLDEANQSIYLVKEGMEIDLGSLAKGFFADKIHKFFEESEVSAGIINLGGNVLVFGPHPVNPDGLWRVGIQDPFNERQNLLGMVKVKDMSVVTSGIYERYLSIDDQDFHHILDSRTGYPIDNDIASITVLSKESVFAELYTTMLYHYDSSDIINLMNQIPDAEAIVITRSKEILLSNNIGEQFVKSN